MPKGAPVAQIVEAEGRLFDAFNLANDEASLTELPPPNSRGSAAAREKPRKPDALPIGQFVAAGTNLQAFADGRTQPHAVVMVEVFQADDGRVVAATVQRSSGVPALDGWAIHIAREAGSALDGAAADAGVSHPGKRYRSLWKLDARVSYRRKLRASELGGREVLAVASSLLLGLVTGQRAPTAGGFDETLGEVDVVDLTSPRYACSVELVEAD